MKSKIKDWLKVLVLLLDEAVAVVIVFFVLRLLGIEVPLPIMIIVALLLGVIGFVICKAVIATFHKKPVTGAGELIGLEGEVVEPLTPNGMVKVKGEYWKAKSLSGDIRAGEEVEVLRMEGLTLRVKRKSG